EDEADELYLATPPVRQPKKRRTRRSAVLPDISQLKTVISEVVEDIFKHRLPSLQVSQQQSAPTQVSVAAAQPFPAAARANPERASLHSERRCWYCGRNGHVQRFCRTRQRHRAAQLSPGFATSGYYFTPPTFTASPTAPQYFQNFPSPSSAFQRGRSRSRSPNPNRSPRSNSPYPVGSRNLSGNQR